jgi:hypothetical protein
MALKQQVPDARVGLRHKDPGLKRTDIADEAL